MQGVGDEPQGRRCFMKSRIIENDHGRLGEDGEKMFGEPLIEPIGIGGAWEQNGGDELLTTFGGDQAGARTLVAGTVAIDFMSDPSPAALTARGGFEAAFIKMNDVVKPVERSQLSQPAQKRDALFKVAFGVFECFFYC